MSTQVKKFEIRLDHDIDEQYQYEPGETIRGEVILSLAQDMSIKSIQVQVRGESMVGLEDENSKTGLSSASETYVDATIPLFGGDNEKASMMTRGDHSFPLEYVLPDSLPSSFIGKLGSITYVVKASLKQSNQIGTMITSEPFLVLRKLDLASMPELAQPRTVKLSKRTNCGVLFCLLGKLEAEFRVTKTGFLPGEDIIIDADIRNDGAGAIKSIQATLILNSIFNAKNHSKQNTQVVNKKVDGVQVEYGGERTWTAVRLAVPPFIPESRLDGCVLIDIQYLLQFKIELEGGETESSIPVVIGTPMEEKRQMDKRKTWNPEKYAVSSGDNYDLSDGIGKSGIAFSDVDLQVQEDEMEKFRHPMQEGETRQNFLYDDELGEE